MPAKNTTLLVAKQLVSIQIRKTQTTNPTKTKKLKPNSTKTQAQKQSANAWGNLLDKCLIFWYNL
ncbi:MAG: hypothetical protein FWD86_00790 [Firmicutes bacterium]|nr:hypothetical protein [Bacillota bacterium]